MASKIPMYEAQVSAEAPLPGRSPERLFADAESFGYNPQSEKSGKELSQVGDLLDNVATEKEVTMAQAQLATLRAQKTVEFQKALSSPDALNDPDFATKFVQKLSDDTSGLADGYSTVGGQKAFARGKAELAGHFLEAAGVAQVQLTGVKATQDYLTALDANRSTLVTDPTQFKSVLASTQAALNDPNGPYARMPEDERLKLQKMTQEQLALSAVEGLSKLNPALAKKQIESGQWDNYVSGANRWQLDGIVDRGMRAQQIQTEKDLLNAERANKVEQITIGNDFLNRMQPGAKNPLTAQDVLSSRLPPVGPGSKTEYLNMMDRANKPEALAAVSHETASKLFTDIHRPVGDPQKITDEAQLNHAFMDSQLNQSDLNFLRKEVQDARTDDGSRLGKTQTEFFERIKPQIDNSNAMMGHLDPTGPEKFYQYQRSIQQKINEYKASGKDPHDLFDPAKPDYVGKPESIAPFQKTLQESMQYIADQQRRAPGLPKTATGAIPDELKRKPGETPADWIKRTGHK